MLCSQFEANLAPIPRTIMIHAMALVAFFLNKIVGSLFNSLVTDGTNYTA